MKATELRVGNWVKLDLVGTQNQVTQILEKGVNCGSIGVLYEMIKPIPLTEEWLERFGFFKDGEYWYRRPAKIPPIYWINSKPLYGINLGSPSLGMFSYVHELQNLIHALTGEELQTDETDQKVNQ